MKIVDKSGAWFNYGSERLGQGREKARDYLKENREVLAKIEAQVREQAATKRAGAAGVPQDAASDEGAVEEE
jgi:recombination protein RecA